MQTKHADVDGERQELEMYAYMQTCGHLQGIKMLRKKNQHPFE